MKIKQLLTLISFTGLFISCNSHKLISVNGDELYEIEKITNDISSYDLFIHDDETFYQLNDAHFNNKNELIGELDKIDGDKKFARDNGSGKKIPASELNDVHIFITPEQSVNKDDLPYLIKSPEKSIRTVLMYAKENDEGLSSAAKTMLIVFGIIALLVLILGIVLIVSVKNTINGSGCYIATMAYGSYDAPEVKVLRSFRDKFLSKYKLGRKFIQWYYSWSPQFAKQHASKKWLHALIKGGLNIWVFTLKLFFRY